MGQTMMPIRLFIVLLFFWGMLNLSLRGDVLVAGGVVALIIALLFRNSLSVLSGYRLQPRALVATIGFAFSFFKDLLKSNLQIARIVLTPSLPIEPTIVRVRTKLTNPVARLMLANSITLTPGTLSIELIGDILYVHCVVADTTDLEAATKAIVAQSEQYLEVMYG